MRFRMRGGEAVETLRAARIVNCTGPECDIVRAGEPLLAALLAAGRIRQDALGIGIEVDGDCRAIGADGAASDTLAQSGNDAVHALKFSKLAAAYVAELAKGTLGGGTGNTAPTVSISAPANGSSYPSGTSVTMTGSANDAQDGPLSGAIVWTSSIDGSLGCSSMRDRMRLMWTSRVLVSPK